MSFNLLDLVKDQVSGQLVKAATGMLGESESGISSALGGIFPTILGSMLGKSSDESGASKVFDLVKSVDPGILGNIGGLFGGGDDDKPDSVMNMGGGLVSSLLGDKLGGAVDMISKIGGIKSGSAMSLFKMAAPMLMGLIGKKVASDGMGLSGFMSLLSDQKDSVSKAMPSGMGSLMGLSSLLGSAKDMVTGAASTATAAATGAVTGAANVASNVAGSAAGAAKTAAATTAKAGNSLFKWLIPALLVLGALYFLSRSSMCKETAIGDKIGATLEEGMDATKDMANTATDAVVDGASAVGSGLSAAFSNVNEAAKTALNSITFATGSAGKQMIDYVTAGGGENATFRFNNLNFESGSARIAGDSGVEVDQIAAILKAYPGVNIQIEGHTDSDGDDAANKALSEARAAAVKARLGAQGIDASRVTSVGYGETMPIGDNATAEGKAQNRRIEVKVMN